MTRVYWFCFLLSLSLHGAEIDSEYVDISLRTGSEASCDVGRLEWYFTHYGDAIDNYSTTANRFKAVMEQAGCDICFEKASQCGCCNFAYLHIPIEDQVNELTHITNMPTVQAMSDNIKTQGCIRKPKRRYIETKGFEYSALCDECLCGSSRYMTCTLPHEQYNLYYFVDGKCGPIAEEGLMGIGIRAVVTCIGYVGKYAGAAVGALCGVARYRSCSYERVAHDINRGSECGEAACYPIACAGGIVVGMSRLGAKCLSHACARPMGMMSGCVLSTCCSNCR